MKRVIGPVMIVALVVIAGGFGYDKYKTKAYDLDKLQNTSRIRQQYLERVGWMRANPDEKTYKDEVGSFFTMYFKDVNEHLNRFAGNRKFDDYLEELEKRAEKGGKEQQIEEKKKTYEYVKQNFDLMKSGKYEPIWTAADKGLRLDILSADVKRVGSDDQIQLAMVLWGASRDMREESRGLKKMVTSASFNNTWKLFDDKGKLMGEVTANGDPAMKVDWPERFIEWFPPQMVLGYFPMEKLPAQATKVEITFAISSRAPSGGDAAANFTWKLDVPAEWKLPAGAAWQGAQDSFRPEEEIDPSKKM